MSESYRNKHGFVIATGYGVADEGGPIKPRGVDIKLFSADKNVVMGVGTDNLPYKWHYTEGEWRVFGLSQYKPQPAKGGE